MEKSDAQLVAESILETQGSFDELVHRYTKPVYNFTYRLCGNSQTAEDCTQEPFIKVWKNLDKYDSGQNFRAWIFTIARNTVTDSLRKKFTIPFSNLSFKGGMGAGSSSGHDGTHAPAIEESFADTEPVPEELIAKLEDAELLTKLLETLSPDYKAVLLLHYQEELTFDEIGKVLGKPLNTVKSWHRRALEELRKLAT